MSAADTDADRGSPDDATAATPMLPPARRSLRLAAAIVDALICLMAVGPAWLTAFVTGDGMKPGSTSFNVFAIGVVIWQGIQAPLITAQGQSIGKWVFGLRILLLDGTRPGFMRGVLLRSWPIQLASQIPAIGWLIVLADTLAIFRPSYRCWHDELAGTCVVEVSRWTGSASPHE